MATCKGFPTTFGNKKAGCVTVVGPASYTTGGFTVQAVTLGIHAFDFASVMVESDSYFASIHLLLSGDNLANPVAALSAQIKVFGVADGAQLSGTNLSAVVFRVLGIGL